jgi:hypothetical protein
LELSRTTLNLWRFRNQTTLFPIKYKLQQSFQRFPGSPCLKLESSVLRDSYYQSFGYKRNNMPQWKEKLKFLVIICLGVGFWIEFSRNNTLNKKLEIAILKNQQQDQALLQYKDLLEDRTLMLLQNSQILKKTNELLEQKSRNCWCFDFFTKSQKSDSNQDQENI